MRKLLALLFILTFIPLVSSLTIQSTTLITDNSLIKINVPGILTTDKIEIGTNYIYIESSRYLKDYVLWTCNTKNVTIYGVYELEEIGCTAGGGGTTGGGSTVYSGNIINTTNVEVIGSSNETFSIVNLNKIEIINERLCTEETKLRFKTLNGDFDFTIIESSELYLNGNRQSNKLFLDLTNEEYYYTLENLEKGEISVKIVGIQEGKRVEEVQVLNVERCIGFDEISKNKLTSMFNFIKDYPEFFLYGIGGIIFLILISYLIIKLR